MSTTKQKNDWIERNKDRVSLLVPKGKKKIYTEHAHKWGQSLNAFTNRAMETQMRLDLESMNEEDGGSASAE